MENKQTAVQWLIEQIKQTVSMSDRVYELEKQAPQMEREQILDAHIDGQSLVSCKDEYAEYYYTQTYV